MLGNKLLRYTKCHDSGKNCTTSIRTENESHKFKKLLGNTN